MSRDAQGRATCDAVRSKIEFELCWEPAIARVFVRNDQGVMQFDLCPSCYHLRVRGRLGMTVRAVDAHGDVRLVHRQGEP